MYLLHLPLGDGLSLKAGVGPALAGVPSGLRALCCLMSEAIEEGHLLCQGEGGQVRLVREKLVAIALPPGTGSWSWFLVLLGLLGLFGLRTLILDR